MGPQSTHLGSGLGFRPNLLPTYHISHPGKYNSIGLPGWHFFWCPCSLPTQVCISVEQGSDAILFFKSDHHEYGVGK